VLFENPPKILIFKIPKFHFEKGYEAQSLLDTKNAPNSTYNANLVFKMLFCPTRRSYWDGGSMSVRVEGFWGSWVDIAGI